MSNGCFARTRTSLGAPPTPRLGVSEAKRQSPGAKNAPRERDGLFDIVRMESKARIARAGAVRVTAPSPLAGEGSSMVLRARKGEGYAARTPHPFQCVGTPLCPLPQGERARKAPPGHFGQTNPTAILAKRTRLHRGGRPRESESGDPGSPAGVHGSRLSLRSAGTTVAGSRAAPTCGCRKRG
jgi:hypothetical protein